MVIAQDPNPHSKGRPWPFGQEEEWAALHNVRTWANRIEPVGGRYQAIIDWKPKRQLERIKFVLIGTLRRS